ncbi:MAG TPA: SDR family NAD(P)-dependent oxidoreductase [Candidatus Solibacter sp.]|jgi:short-subunit dehydrogenase|nr:SDR family NAD(P)-dependent oxidoreductase [Candidatus Solibacter sp.]
MKDIGGKVVVVTGASRGLGRAIAQALFDHGMKVVLSARGAEDLDAFQKQLDRGGSRSLAVAADVTSAADRTALIAATRKKFGQVDVLVNNAGTDHPEFFADADFTRVESMVALNLTALMAMTQAVLPEMLERRDGHVVNIASMAGLAPVPFAAVYSATKHAVIGFSESIRYEVADHGVGVSVVCPGYVREAGLYHENSEGSGSVPTVAPSQVGEAVVSAITGDRARVLATAAAMKVTPLLTAIAPGLTYFASKRTGNADEMRKMADNLKARELSAKSGDGQATKPRRRAAAKVE